MPMHHENDLLQAHDDGRAAALHELEHGTTPRELTAKVSHAVPAHYAAPGPLRRQWQIGYIRAAIQHLKKPAPCLAPLPIAGSPTDTA